MKRHLNCILFFLIIFYLAESISLSSPTLVDMVITKTANVSSVQPGDIFIYNLYVTNESFYNANDVLIIDVLPAGLSLQSWNWNVVSIGNTKDVKYIGDGIWWPNDNNIITGEFFSSFESLNLEITVQLDPLYTGNQIINTARVMTLDADSNYPNNESTLTLPVVIPAPGAILLGSIGIGFVGWLRRHRMI